MLDRLGLRHFTPSELLRPFHFVDPDHSFDFVWPSDVSLKPKYHFIGNSVNVEVNSWHRHHSAHIGRAKAR